MKNYIWYNKYIQFSRHEMLPLKQQPLNHSVQLKLLWKQSCINQSIQVKPLHGMFGESVFCIM
ncbi:hypothetical protein I5907_21065 [Panacibacter sp. DH6]|uniref:Uncharacterized protein n=1 Tax=Panacibacter microcysteis TaxID=2793269 RepID=A0A931H0H9_9BACT|nr:hypothetical protein [Panacibacter microcysteis]MBG9378736.1 hypothetical protein [Panacibacter microcysteis]